MTDKTVGEEVVRYDLEPFNRYGPEMAASADGDYVLFDDHQRLLEEAKARDHRRLSHRPARRGRRSEGASA
jgi:hypothetical protein